MAVVDDDVVVTGVSEGVIYSRIVGLGCGEDGFTGKVFGEFVNGFTF
jgi:hypothetical protein